MVVVHNKDPMKNCENTPIERTPKTIYKASFGLKNRPDPLLIFLRLLPKNEKTSYVYGIYIFHVVENTPISPSSSFAYLQSTQSGNHE